jgi:hypothetical protein
MIFNFIRAPKEPDPMPSRPFPTLVLLTLLALPAAHPAAAEDDAALAERDRIEALERKVELLTDELARTRQDIGVPEDEPLESAWGLGPAASKVYGIGKGLSIGGYAEALYTNVVDDKRKSGDVNRFDMLRTVLYAGYKFTDHIVFNTELEFEHATTSSTESSGSGSVSVEFATLDFLLRDEINARAGLMLVPMGFLNKMHEPPFYYGTHRPDVERLIIPSTWRENGAGIFGRLGEIVEYELYAITAPNGAGFGEAGLRGGRQNGNRALAEDMAFVGRVDVELIPQLSVGGSVLVGETGQEQRLGVIPAFGGGTVEVPDSQLILWEGHAELQTHGLHVRALATMAHIDDASQMTLALRQSGDIGAAEVVASEMLGVYGEVGYEVMQWLAPDSGWSVEPFVRVEHVDTQQTVPGGFLPDRTRAFEVYTAGLQVKPIPQVVLKLDYRNRQARSGALGDEVNLGMGVVF